MILIFNSCVPEEEPAVVPVSDLQQAVEDAKTWFGPQEEFEVPVSSGASAKAKARTKKIQWNKAITHDNGRVIEVPVKYSAHSVPMRGDTTKVLIKEKQKNSFYRLLIRKDSLGNHFKSLLKFFPEQYVDGQSRIEVNNFMSISNQFSGDIQLADWEENLEMGWLIANGNVVERYYEKKHGIKEKSYANAAVECRYVEKEVCTYYYEDNPLYEEGIGWEQQNVVECHFYIVPECSEINDGGPGWAGGGGSGSGPTGPVPGGGSGSGTGGLPYIPTDEELIDEWEDQIDATQLNPCIKDVLIDLKSLTTGVGNIVSQFAGDTPGYNWVVKSGATSGANATTNPRYNRSNQTVTTTFSNSSFGSATDLSIARTILHESVHAFLVVQMSNITSYDVFYKEYPMLMEDFMDIEVPLNQAQHHEMIRFYVDRIGVSLKEYGEMNGYNLPIQFYNDLAWGGLMDIPTEFDSHRLPTAYGESAWFKVLNQDRSVRDRIRNVVNVEQNGKDVNGNTKPQKGNDSGC